MSICVVSADLKVSQSIRLAAASPTVTLAEINGATHVLSKPVAAAEIIRIIGTLGLANDSIGTTKPAASPRALP